MKIPRIIFCFVVLLLLLSSPHLSAQWDWQTPNPQGNSLNAIEFLTPNPGWAAGNYRTILLTADGAQTWVFQEYGRTDDLRGVVFVDPLHGWAVGELGTLLHTTDGGVTWIPQIFPSQVTLFGVAFTNLITGWIVGDEGKILHTDDGMNWVEQARGTSSALLE